MPALAQGDSASNASHREGRGIVLGAGIDQAGVGRNVTIASALRIAGDIEVMSAYLLRISFAPQLTTPILEIANHPERSDLALVCSNCMSRAAPLAFLAGTNAEAELRWKPCTHRFPVRCRARDQRPVRDQRAPRTRPKAAPGSKNLGARWSRRAISVRVVTLSPRPERR